MSSVPQPLDPEVERKLAAIKPLLDRLPRDRYWVYDVDLKGPRFQDRPFTDARLMAHLEGKARYGLPQMERGSSTTRVAYLDFDDHDNLLPAGALAQAVRNAVSTLELLGFRPTVWTSGGGVGAHVILIWDKPQDAYSVRSFLKDLLACCPHVDNLKIEIFPKQDRLTSQGKGSQGSMVWLPFNRASTPWTTSSISWVDWRASPDVPYLEPPARTTNAEIERSADLERLREATLAVAHADGDRYGSRDEWRNFVFAIHSATQGSEEGFELADEFSSLVPKYEDPDDVRKLWDSASLDKDNTVGTDLILKRAEQAGWQDPQALVDVADLVEADAPAPKPTPRGRLVDAADAVDRAPPRWLIKGVLPEGDLVVLYGASGSGKSFVALDMAVALATGKPWYDRPCRQGRVIYIVAEGTGGFPKRLRALAAQGVDLRAVGPSLRLYEGAPSLLDANAVSSLQEILAEDRAAHGAPSVIVVDTFAQTMAGGNENAGEDVSKALKSLRKLGATAGATVLLVHHSGKDETKGARGWSGLRAAADAEFEVTRDAESRMHIFKTTKQKDGDDELVLGFRLRVVETGRLDEDGEPETSCIVAPADIVEAAEVVKGRWHKLVAKVLEGVEGPLSTSQLTDLAKSLTEPETDGKGVDRRADSIKRAVRDMTEKGLLAVRGDQVVALKSLKAGV